MVLSARSPVLGRACARAGPGVANRVVITGLCSSRSGIVLLRGGDGDWSTAVQEGLVVGEEIEQPGQRLRGPAHEVGGLVVLEGPAGIVGAVPGDMGQVHRPAADLVIGGPDLAQYPSAAWWT